MSLLLRPCQRSWRTITGSLAMLVAIMSAGVAAATPADAAAADAKSLACEFSSGQSSTFDGGAFKTKAPAPLNFLVVDIDVDKQTARISTGDAGTMGNLKIVRALNAIHFIEVLNEGFLTLTTVYDIDTGGGTHPAVHSRHMGVLGQPVVAHYTGTCSAR